jgi:hypothetical protein
VPFAASSYGSGGHFADDDADDNSFNNFFGDQTDSSCDEDGNHAEDAADGNHAEALRCTGEERLGQCGMNKELIQDSGSSSSCGACEGPVDAAGSSLPVCAEMATHFEVTCDGLCTTCCL